MTYNERDTFIKLLSKDPCNEMATDEGCHGCPYEHALHITRIDNNAEHGLQVEGSCFELRYADYLIKSGVVLPPVDVGQTVWYINGGYYNSSRLEPRAIEVTEISKKKCGKIVDWAFIANRTRYKFSSIGKTVFLTKQDCEAAIQKRKNK